MTDDPVLLDIGDRIATITLNEPDRYNPWSLPIVNGLKEALGEAERADPRCLVIQGAGPAFSAGGDIDWMSERIEEGIVPHERVRLWDRAGNEAIRRVVNFPAPVVAKIDGAAAGVGANLAIACDVLLASERSMIMFAFRNVGLNVDGGTSVLLPRLVGENVAKELVFSGEIVEADRAEELGIFNHVYPEEEFEEKVAEKVDLYASGPTRALRYSKKLITDGRNKSIERGLEDELIYQAMLLNTHDHEEGVSAFLDDRDPEFQGE